MPMYKCLRARLTGTKTVLSMYTGANGSNGNLSMAEAEDRLLQSTVVQRETIHHSHVALLLQRFAPGQATQTILAFYFTREKSMLFFRLL